MTSYKISNNPVHENYSDKVNDKKRKRNNFVDQRCNDLNNYDNYNSNRNDLNYINKTGENNKISKDAVKEFL